jgi:FKBP-type peptidyl-prolyl cis-trans isomerase FkpA
LYLASQIKCTIMNKFKLYFILLLSSGLFFSCNKEEDAPVTPPREFAPQYAEDIAAIENFLKTNYLTQVTIDGQPDVVFTPIPNPNPENKISIWDNTIMPLQSITVKSDDRVTNLVGGRKQDDVSYKLYYLKIREGDGLAPISTDSTFTTYSGRNLKNEEFESSNIPFWSTFPALSQFDVTLISGYRQFTTLLKTSATIPTQNLDGTINYGNIGIGVVFIPSGLGYFNTSRTGIPSYSPLIFRIRLHAIKNRDHDRDGILSKDEDLNSNGDLYDDDTDGDTVPNFLDIDDDNDFYSTKTERIKTTSPLTYYNFNEIPTCNGGNGLKRHLDKKCP